MNFFSYVLKKAGLILVLLPALSQALRAEKIDLPTYGPIPLRHPSATLSSPEQPVDNIITATTQLPFPTQNTPAEQVSFSPALKRALDAFEEKKYSLVKAEYAKMTPNSVPRQLLGWLLGTSGAAEITSSEISSIMTELRNWPDTAHLLAFYERAVARENHPPAQTIALLTDQTPQTAMGVVALGNALVQQGQSAKARTLIVPWWVQTKLSREEEDFVLANLHESLLHKSDHLQRMKMMFHEKRFDSADILSRHAEARPLYLAAIAVARGDKDAAQKLAQIDKSWHEDQLYHFSRIQHLRRSHQYDEAGRLLLKMTAQELQFPDAWWFERRVMAREMLDLGKYKVAYQLVYDQGKAKKTGSIQAADAEFHAGWIALRFLQDAKTARKHFTRLHELSSRSTSQARALYWLGRTEEALRNPQATYEYYRQGSRFLTTFYGQLAAAKLGQKSLDIPYFKPTQQERTRFSSNKTVQAIRLLHQAKWQARADMLVRALAQQLDKAGELALLAAMVEKQGNHHLSLKIGKDAAARGLDVGALTHPTGTISATGIPLDNKALAYAIARQESEFNPKAKSPAGARGLLQLMPKTAKSVARAHNIAYSLDRLSNDSNYNAALGGHFLADQLGHFNGSYILTFIGYNAGSGRASKWIARYGDPRGRSLDDVVDWIERIPFTETRNYVQRVMENYQIYQARLGGNPDIVRDLTSNH